MDRGYTTGCLGDAGRDHPARKSKGCQARMSKQCVGDALVTQVMCRRVVGDTLSGIHMGQIGEAYIMHRICKTMMNKRFIQDA